MKEDPKVRRDGRCALPGCTNRLAVMTERHRRYGGDVLLIEPFCSTDCCRVWHDNPRPRYGSSVVGSDGRT